MTHVTEVAGATERADRFAAAKAVADATLYEGYVLYPYRASAVKNQMRWQFGVLAPRAWAEADGSERWTSRTECLVVAGAAPRLTVRVRFLQILHRTIEAATEGGGFAPVTGLEVGTTRWVPWDEAVERVVDVAPVALAPVGDVGHRQPFTFEAGASFETIVTPDGDVAGRVVRRWETLTGTVLVDATAARGPLPLARVAVAVENDARWAGRGATRDEALARSLIGVHTLLGLDDGGFVSLLDPPEGTEEAAAECHNVGTFPVLVADPSGGPDVVLSSPITLYDHPEVAPESQGDLYDSTEIDEILALRVLTLTDDEKAEARGTDARSAAIVDRCDDMTEDGWAQLHGTMRDVRATERVEPSGGDAPWWDPAVDAEVDPWSDSIRIAGTLVAKGSAVVLRPNRRSDAQDLFLDGLSATVAGIFHDVDGTQQVAVTVDDDPATEALSWQGRYLFFFPDEIEPAS